MENNNCPLCNAEMYVQCRCAFPHTLESLKKGHGKLCKNGHRWGKDANGEIIILKESYLVKDDGVDGAEYINEIPKNKNYVKIVSFEKLEDANEYRNIINKAASFYTGDSSQKYDEINYWRNKQIIF